MQPYDIESFDLPTFDPTARSRPVARRVNAAPKKKVVAPVAAAPSVKAPEANPAPSPTVAEVEALRSELAALRAEIEAIKNSAALEERRRADAQLFIADLAYRNAI
jgi:hypothetical protein